LIILDDTYTFADFGLIELQGHEHPMTPVVEQKTLAIPGRPGLWHFGTENREKQFSVSLGLIEYDKYEKQRKLNAIVAFLHDAYGQPREIKWVYDYEPDKFYTVKLAEQINPERLIHAARFTLAFVAYFPYKRFIVPSDAIIWDSDVPILSDAIMDTGLTEWTITKPQTLQVINNGSKAIPFTFLLEGSGTNVSISANGKTMTLGSFTSKTIEVAENYTVKVDGTDNLTISNGVFPELLPGVNQVSIAGSGLNLTISEKITYQYL
jgi:predicted phage tail component-like protein